MLRKPQDYRNWDKLIQHCDALDGLTDFEKEKAKRAFQFLRQELGENFLEDAFSSQHPICQYVINLAPWTRKWIIWLGEALRELRKHQNYSKLLSRIKDRNKFGEALSILEVAYKFSRIGFEIIIDPKLKYPDGERVPDLKLTDADTQEELFVEVSALHESRIARDASQTMQKITEPLWRCIPFLHFCGRIYKILSQRHLDYIVKKVEETVEKAKRENSFQELVIEDVIEMGIAPETDKQLLEKWATERGLKIGEFSGPPFNVNEILRTKRAIEKEQKQLPRDYPNILIIWNSNLFFTTRDIRRTISEIEEEIYEYAHLLVGVIARGHMGLTEKATIMKNQHIFVKKARSDLLVEEYIILLNRFCEHKISASTITKIYNAFINY